MARDLNQCNFIGRIGQDIDIRYMPDGKAVANISLACSDDYKDKNTGQKVEQTNWINIVMFGRLAEILDEYCNKGSKIFVSGKQRTRKWTGQDGQDHYKTEIVASGMQMLDACSTGVNSQSNGQSQQAPLEGQVMPQENDFDDSIPF
jgi:single-strand DNA-binding protein